DERKLVRATDQRRPRPLLDVDPEPAPRGNRAPDGDGAVLPLHADRVELLVLDGRAGHPIGELAHHDTTRRRESLETRGDVDDVARDEAFPVLRPGAERDHRFARVDRRPDGKVQARTLLVQLRDRIGDPERRAHGAFGVVLVGDRSTEHGHHRVADELLHGPPEPFDLALQEVVVEAEGRTDVLGIGVVRTCREPDQVDEQDRDDLAFLRTGGRPLAERCAAGRAEPRVLGVLLTAARASHARSLWREDRADPGRVVQPGRDAFPGPSVVRLGPQPRGEGAWPGRPSINFESRYAGTSSTRATRRTKRLVRSTTP